MTASPIHGVDLEAIKVELLAFREKWAEHVHVPANLQTSRVNVILALISQLEALSLEGGKGKGSSVAGDADPRCCATGTEAGDLAGAVRATIAEAFHDGFLAGLGGEPWCDASDFAILVGLDYADGKDAAETLPSSIVNPTGWGSVRAYCKAIARHIALLPGPQEGPSPIGASPSAGSDLAREEPKTNLPNPPNSTGGEV